MAQAPQGNWFQRAFAGNSNSGNQNSNQNNNNNQQQGNQQQQRGNQQQNNGNQNQQRQGQQNNGQQQQGNQGNQGATNDPETQQTPLDAYKGLWDNADTNAEQAPKFEIDGKLIDSTAANMDFLHGLPDDMQQSLQALGENAPHFAKLLNHVGRKAYASAISHNSVLTGKYLDVKGQFDQKGLGRTIKQQMALTGIDAHKVAQSNPIVRENLRMIAQNLTRLNPDATPQWIEQKSVEFFTQMADALSPKAQQDQLRKQEQQAPGGQDFNWENWMKEQPATQEQ